MTFYVFWVVAHVFSNVDVVVPQRRGKEDKMDKIRK